MVLVELLQEVGPPQAVREVHQAVKVVAHLHTVAQVCHRDIKPENLLVLETVDSITIKLADFDLTVMITDMRAIASTACGTLPFAAPEVLLSGQYDCCSADIWSLGVVLMEVLCGVRIVEQAIEQVPQEPPEVPPADSNIAMATRISSYFKEHTAEQLLQERCRAELSSLVPEPATTIHLMSFSSSAHVLACSRSLCS